MSKPIVLDRECLVNSKTENLVRLAKFMDAPLWEHLEEGPRRHNIINAIQRIEKALAEGRQHPFKTIKLKEV